MTKKIQIHNEGNNESSNGELERLLTDSVPVNIYEFAKGKSPRHGNGASCETTPNVIGTQSQKETEKLWQNRLQMLLNAERTLNNVTRFRKLTSLAIAASIAVIAFSVFASPSLPAPIFYGILSIGMCGIATYPAWLVASKSAQSQRDSISRMFYKSNHEVELSNGEVTLINRANYASVTKIQVVDSNIGKLAI